MAEVANNSPPPDWSDPTVLLREIFENDKWIKDRFSESLSAEILGVAERVAPCFSRFKVLDQLSVDNERASYVASFFFGVLDDLIVSTKLLVSGKTNPAGNVMRQAIEGLAIALLCSTKELVWIRGQKEMLRINYLDKLKKNSEHVHGHLAIPQLALNVDVIGVSQGAVERLKSARNHYNQFSHAGVMGMGGRMPFRDGGEIFLGGGYDPKKLDYYRYELLERQGLAGVLPNTMNFLIEKLQGDVTT